MNTPTCQTMNRTFLSCSMVHAFSECAGRRSGCIGNSHFSMPLLLSEQYFPFFFHHPPKTLGFSDFRFPIFVISSFRFAQKGRLADSIHCLLLTIGYCDALLAGINGPSPRRNLCPFFFHPFAITIFLATKPRHHDNTDRPKTPHPRQIVVCFHHIVQNVYSNMANQRLSWYAGDQMGDQMGHGRETRFHICTLLTVSTA